LAAREDLGRTGDLTSRAIIPADRRGKAAFVARRPGVLAGLPFAGLALRRFDESFVFTPSRSDGESLHPGDWIATVEGPSRSLLTAERTTLNFLQHLSGIATLTRRYVDAIAGTRAVILDTRKTLPGWRLLEKYAVRMGGGRNHRIGLYDAILIKDNHLAGLRDDIDEAVRRCRVLDASLPVEIEVDSLEQLERALACGPNIVLLDNMTPDQLREAVSRRDAVAPGIQLEASGGVNLDTVRGIAETGVDRISVGALTHSAPALDIALDYVEGV
jgi:nicotinate-nucleotide pyrophosphorylase (carboxylating)